MNKKMNNKGFSLVELIVVIAIMGILAVTLAPRLSAYVEKSRQASDKEIINTIMTAAKLGFVEENIYNGFTGIATQAPAAPDPAETYTLTLNNTPDDYYLITNRAWAVGAETDAFSTHLYDVAGNFNFKSTNATASTQITILYTIETDTIQITLDYNGDGVVDPVDYQVSSR